MLPPELSPLASTVAEIIALGIFVTMAAALLGYLSDGFFGGLFLALRSAGATTICVAHYIGFAWIGHLLIPSSTDTATRLTKAGGWAAAGLVIAMIAVAGLGVRYGKTLGSSEPGKQRGAIFIAGLWAGFCFASWIGHVAGRWIGLLTVTLPATVMFWLVLYYLARFILPLDQDQPVSMAFRCLLTFSAGTNYPYYAVEDREKVERVPGNQTGLFYCGPGIFLTGPDHVVAVSNNLKFTGVRGPGVVFTKQWEEQQHLVDLRTQQRSYQVEAVTKDGIRVNVTAFGPFQLDVGARQPKMGKPFPSRASSVFKAFRAQPVEIRRDKHGEEITEERRQRRWDELYAIVGTYVLQDIIAKSTFNELCEPLDLRKDPRKKIAEEYKMRLNKELKAYGIDTLRKGGISNLMPADQEAVFKRRIQNWQAQLQRKMLESLGAAEAEAELLIGQARAQVQAEMIQNIGEAIAEITTDDREVIANTVRLRFIEALNRMVAHDQIGDRLPRSIVGVIDSIRYLIDEMPEDQPGDGDV